MIVGTFMSGKRHGDRVYQAVYTARVLTPQGQEYHFLCDCGNTFSIKHTSKLKNDGKFRCRDCYVLRDSESFSPEWGYRLAMKRIKNDASRAGRVFEITLDEFKEISQQDCHYCGSAPSNVLTYKSNAGTFTRTFVYTGMDRMDNKVGYVRTNVVPCCIICNRAKNSMGYEEFMAWILRVAERYNGISEAPEGQATQGNTPVLERAYSC